MIKIKNLSTGEVIVVNDVKWNGENIVSEKGIKGAKFIARVDGMLEVHDAEADSQYFTLKDGFEAVRGRASKPSTGADEKPATAPKPASKPRAQKPAEPTAATEGDKPSEPTVSQPTGTDEAEIIKNDLQSRYGALGADIFAAVCKAAHIFPISQTAGNVDEIAKKAVELLQSTASAPTIKKIIASHANSESGDVFCSDFDEICDYVAEGQPVYMWGAAGCGKSHTAEQIARRLGLDYYTQSQILFAHDVKGYGDANGAYVDTPFFKAFTNGGLFFIDEMDASAAEALVVLNTAIANRRYDFPVIGNVEAHPNFRIVAAGNTALTGADVEYVARSVQDASTVNRFSFFEMKYEKNVELPIMCRGDKELYEFIVDLRQAIKTANIQLTVSYRQSHILASPLAEKYGKTKALLRNVFGGREKDDIRVIYGAMKKPYNAWTKAMAAIIA